jgi:hypothetical protein
MFKNIIMNRNETTEAYEDISVLRYPPYIILKGVT